MALKLTRRLLALVLAAVCGCSQAATQAQIDNAWTYGLWSLIKNQNGDGYWQSTNDPNVIATALAVQALNRAPLKTTPYNKAVSWLANARPVSVDAISRQILALSTAGVPAPNSFNRLYSWANFAPFLGWGAYDRHMTSFPDTPLALAAWRAEVPFGAVPISSGSWASAICSILLGQSNTTTSGTWGYFGPEAYGDPMPVAVTTPAILPAAFNLIEIEQYRLAGSTGLSCNTASGTISFTLSTVIANGVAWLAARQNPDGGFGTSSTSSVLETAYVYQTLSALSPGNPARIAAENYLVTTVSTSQGGWNNDSLLTALVLSVLPPPSAAVILDSDGDGVPNVVEVLMATNPNVADAVYAGGGNTAAGLRAAGYGFPAAPLNVGQPVAFTTSASGGQGPYGWSLVAGTLPVGLFISPSNGTIAGTPLVVGSYAFVIALKDAAGTAVNTTSVLGVTASNNTPLLQNLLMFLLDD